MMKNKRIITTAMVLGIIALGAYCGKRPNPRFSSTQVEEIPELPLQKIDIKIGEGKLAEKGKGVIVHYIGSFDNGQQFDNSRQSNRPFGFTLGERHVIQGWTEGIEGMREGGVRKLIIPPHLAYGRAGMGRIVPPNATLTFDIELLEVLDEPIEKPGPVSEN